MVSRAPHALEAWPPEEVGHLSGLPEWVDHVKQPGMDGNMDDQEELADEPLPDDPTGESSPGKQPAQSLEAEEKQYSSDLDEKDELPDDISISDGEPEMIDPAPTGELTLAAVCAPNLSLTRRLVLLSASVAINVGLPFINGVFLGFGEIFARAFVAPWLGLAPPLLNYNPYSPSPADVPPLDSIPPGGMRSWARGVKERSHEKKDENHA
ncbi:hypothetical protein MPSI1_001988 [Malassezia psittaci]|uniref:Uncharacterized protein n=1 Tax=Malassezia psittaci TaxID=1821823 RepID=A0AAF0FER4_9BASI|nr:hypothetical protein MPSI1_001988 [Malassezia psittaci]